MGLFAYRPRGFFAACNLALWLVACATGRPPSPTSPAHAASNAEPNADVPATPEQQLERARSALEESRYGDAEVIYRAALDEPSIEQETKLGLARVLLVTGRYTEAIDWLGAFKPTSDEARATRSHLRAEALRRTGHVEEAEQVLREVVNLPEARRARLALGELLIETGRRAEANEPLMALIEEYNTESIDPKDGPALALVGRAAHLLRSPHDANDAFDEAEIAEPGNIQTLLWRAELFLEKYNPADAAQVIDEILAKAPQHPEALVWKANVKLAESLDFGAAEKLAERALTINPNLSRAHFVLAGLALRDLELESADSHLARGLQANPRDLELLSMHAAVRFLADDAQGFSKAKTKVLELNPQYSQLYNIVGEYAEWEHRYDEIVELMREAVAIDDDDAKAHAQLGLNLIRAGHDPGGLQALRRAFSKDPFNVRVFNTLNLYEKVIATDYSSVQRGRFKIRYPNQEQAILDRYVPALLDEAWGKMTKAYGFEPSTPVGIELYTQREHFAIRTSGLPNTAIQGVCFGHTLASLSPLTEEFNLGMVLWHELAHVFHIQKSRSHVPRWFTEGLAEYETIIERPEWQREHDPALYQALADKRLPKLGAMNQAFTHAEDISDVATAYYASSQILVFLADQYGRPALNRMLDLWGAGQRTPAVIQTALGVDLERVNQQIEGFLAKQLVRYDGQFMPPRLPGDPGQLLVQVERNPSNPDLLLRRALVELRAGEVKRAKVSLQAAKSLPGVDKALLGWTQALLAEAKGQGKRSLAELDALVASGIKSYSIQLKRANLAHDLGNQALVAEALSAAHQLDPSQSEPLYGLYRMAKEQQDEALQVQWLEKLARLEQHSGHMYAELVKLLLKRDRVDEAVQVGRASIYVDMDATNTHLAYAEALLRAKRFADAGFELESALLGVGRPQEKATAHVVRAELELSQGQRAKAKLDAEAARKLDPTNERLNKLKL